MAGEDKLSGGDELFLRAGELALGVLEGEGRTAAQRQVLVDADFAAAVRWWERRLGAMAEEAGSAEPSPEVWAAIEARLASGVRAAAPATLDARTRGPSGWSVATALAGLAAAAAALALYLNTPALVQQAPEPITSGREQLIAQLSDDDGARRLAGRIDTGRSRLYLTVTGLDAEVGKAPELWVIPAGGTPASLGAIPRAGSFARALQARERALLVAGATLAVTFEDDTGARHTVPTMPIVLAGPLSQV